MTPADARFLVCPLLSIGAPAPVCCIADQCALWEWIARPSQRARAGDLPPPGVAIGAEDSPGFGFCGFLRELRRLREAA